MSRIAHCEACAMIKAGVKTRIALEHTCGLESGNEEFDTELLAVMQEAERSTEQDLEKVKQDIAMDERLLQLAMKSPALQWKSTHKGKAAYPERFGGKVPLKVKLRCNVYPDLPIGVAEGTECIAGKEYYVWVNNLGAVAAILPNGEQLGLKPDEFDVTEYHA